MENIANETLLTVLGYTENEASKAKLARIIDNTEGFDNIKKHIVQLNDALKPYNSFVGISNSEDYFKVKSKTKPSQMEDIVVKWADKYKVELKKLDSKETFYILGKSK